MRKLGFALSYCAYLAIVVALVDYAVFWRPFYVRLSGAHGFVEMKAPRYVDRLTMRQLGSLRGDRRSSFPSFPMEKPAGALRVCAFGDSFTYGDEVADGHDYPALLQDVFKEQGMPNVEVLNFGNSWYGFHQAYIMWDRIGRRFGCDFVLQGPDCFQSERDTTFNHSNLAFPYYIHSRYVLHGADVLRIDPLGLTQDERFAEYFAFRPRSPYLRYDRNAPAFLLAVLPSNRTLENPFYYYRGTPDAEAQATYAALLRRLAREPVETLLFHSKPPIVDVANAVGAPNLVGVLAPRMDRFPYNAIGGHYSSFGNRWVAEQYFAELTTGDYRPTVLDFADVPPRPSPAPAGASTEAPAPISSFARVYLELGGRRAGLLAVASPIPGERHGKAEDLAGSPVAGLLALAPEGKSLVDAAFVPTSVVPREGDRVVLRGGGREIPIGSVHLIDAHAAVGVAVIRGIAFAGALYLSGDTLDIGGGPFSVIMGETPILGATPADARLRLQSLVAELRNVRVGEGEYVPIADLGETGTVTMKLEGATSSVELPLVRWRKHAGDTFPTERHLPARIALADGAAKVQDAQASP